MKHLFDSDDFGVVSGTIISEKWNQPRNMICINVCCNHNIKCEATGCEHFQIILDVMPIRVGISAIHKHGERFC